MSHDAKLKPHAVKEVTFLIMLASKSSSSVAREQYKKQADALSLEWDITPGDVEWDFGAWLAQSF